MYPRMMLVILLAFGLFAQANDGGAAVTAAEINPLLVGAKVPDVQITLPDGTPKSLRQVADGKKSVFIFYRGSWCPFCMKQLSTTAKTMDAAKRNGYQFFAVAQDTPAENAKVMKKHKLDFPILSDSSLEAAGSFGLLFQIDSKTKAKYKEYGIDLEGLYGRSQPLMPVPGIYVVDEKGVITFSYVNPDYRVRLDDNVLAAVLGS